VAAKVANLPHGGDRDREGIMGALKILAAAALVLSPVAVQAATCEQFAARIVEGAAMYQVPAPQFQLDDVNSADANIRYWSITMFDDARAVVSCWHGSVHSFLADANGNDIKSSIHLMLLMAMGLHGYGLEWRPALELRDQLVRAAKASDPHVARLPVEGGEASLIVSIAGVPSFQIDTK
jgi:hypothetical protein